MTRWWEMRAALGGGLAVALCAVASAALAQQPGRRAASVAIYQPGAEYGGNTYGGVPVATAPAAHAVVVEERVIDVASGDSEVAVGGVAARLDPSTARLRVVGGEPVDVRQLRFAEVASGAGELLQRAVGSRVEAITSGGTVAGTLVAADARQVVIDTGSGDMPLHIVARGPHLRDLRLAAAPAALLVREPTLVWKVAARAAGRRRVELGYRTAGLSWRADYAVVFDAARNRAEVSAWATIRNRAGVDLRGAAITLVSTAAPPVTAGSYAPVAQLAARGGRSAVSLGEPLDLDDGEAVQVELFAPVDRAKAARVFVYEPLADVAFYAAGYPNIDCYGYQYQPVSAHSEEYLEVALPRDRPLLPGRSRLFRADEGGRPQLIGDGELRTAPGVARFEIGRSADIAGERRQLECHHDEGAKTLRERIELVVRNRGREDADVIVREYMQRWTNWSIDSESAAGATVGAVSREYRVMVPAGSAKSIDYTVTYTW